jgi:hypothetical protein
LLFNGKKGALASYPYLRAVLKQPTGADQTAAENQGFPLPLPGAVGREKPHLRWIEPQQLRRFQQHLIRLLKGDNLLPKQKQRSGRANP